MDSKKTRKSSSLYNKIAISSIIISILSLIIIGGLISFPSLTPRCTTCFYHFNLDYRLGLEETEDRIIRESYHELLKLYERHPNWAFTIECQAELMLSIYKNPEYQEIEELTNKLLERKQMELMCVLQFSQLYYAYPADAFDLNLKHANETLKDLGLLQKRSNCILFQEGQYAPGLVKALNSPHTSNVDTVLVSLQQVKGYHNPTQNYEDYPVYSLRDEDSGKSIKILKYDYFPKREAGFLHTWNYLYDAELAFEDEEAEEEFTVSQEKVRAFEEEMLMLEKEGNKFFTCSEWVEHCESVGAIGDLDYYIPESNWNTAEYNSSYIWMANNKGSCDDGEMLANNYRCRQIIFTTETVYEKYRNLLPPRTQNSIEEKFYEAERLWLQATCTDSTGLTPRYYERIKAEENVLRAQKLCAQIMQILANNINILNVNRVQVDLKSKEIYTSESNFISLLQFEKGGIPVSKLPLNIKVSMINERVDVDYGLDPSISLLKYSSSDELTLLDTFQVYRIDYLFIGTKDWANDSIKKISIKFTFKNDENNFNNIYYCPSLLESEIERLYHDFYDSKPLYIFLPLSNGLIFIPTSENHEKGIALIKDINKRHTSWLWEKNGLEILETNGLHLDAHHRVYLLENVSLGRAVKFANRINVNPPWIISKDVSLIQGNQVYKEYARMENKDK